MPFGVGDKVRFLRSKSGVPTRDTPVAEVMDIRTTKRGNFYKLRFLNGFMLDVPEELLASAWSGKASGEKEGEDG